MKEPLNISIPKPCTQSWADMSATTGGKYCSSCQQEVKDFTSMNGFEIQQWFQLHQTGKTCGRFHENQMPALLTDLDKINPSTFLSLKVFLFSLLTFPLSLKSAQHQVKSKVPLTISPIYNSMAPEFTEIKDNSDSTKILKGVIVDGKEPLVGAMVMIKETKLKTHTDKDGKFELDLSSLETDSKAVIRVAYLGYEFKEEKLNLKNLKPLRIIMTDFQCLMGEVVIKKSSSNLFKRIIRGL
ncbi:carboxypeptidase-like regulatory domain-containing protein [Pedobacter sp. GR22-6]|uniref:carboxypeptidase-like regulatory domain-containing protein n=1 Tax=Pedobacter sp. GR22-6 TaxID=3127957 RepID=UPI00307D3CB0